MLDVTGMVVIAVLMAILTLGIIVLFVSVWIPMNKLQLQLQLQLQLLQRQALSPHAKIT